MTRIVLDVLREATGPMTTHEIAYEMIALRAMDRDDKRLVRRITKRVGVALRELEIKGVTRTEPKVGRFQPWSLLTDCGDTISSRLQSTHGRLERTCKD